MNIINLSVSDLIPYENNPRHNETAVDAVAESIKKFGFLVPIVIDKNKVIAAGHTRLMAARRLGMDVVPCVMAEDLSDEQIKAFRLADNKTGELATWDFEKLDLELSEITSFDMTEFGFETQDEDADDTEVSEDDYKGTVPDEPKAKPGDLYQLGDHRLLCGDCTDVTAIGRLMDGSLGDMVLTDPPYNMNYEGAGNTKDRKSKRIMNDHMPEDKFREFLEQVYETYYIFMKDGASIYVFYKELGSGVFMQSMGQAGLTFKQELIWVKNQIVIGGNKYQNMYEPCLMGCKGGSIKKWNGARNQRSVVEDIDYMSEDELRSTIKELLSEAEDIDVLREKKNLINDLHPTMKPIRLLAKFIRN